MSLALYRRYRPDTFAQVIGQDHVTEPLQHALANDRVHHAYLFSGPRGCGKTTSARILARALNCERGPAPEPCGECGSCLDLARDGGGSLDVVEIDAASHGGVDDARDLRDRAFFAPASSRYKIYIIDEAHMVSREGFNALLKVVEEPPPHLKFIFATTEPDKVLGTIRSRTHHYPFRLVPPRVLQDHLQQVCDSEGVQVGPGVLPMVVRAAAGSVRDALSVLDQLIGGAGPEGVTHAYAASLLGYTDAALLDDVVDAFAASDGAAVFEMVDRVVDSGIDPRRFAVDLLERLRDLIVLQAVPGAAEKGLLHAPEDQLVRMENQAARFGPAELSRAAEVVHEGLAEMRGATSPRLLLELVCARVLLPGADIDGDRGMRARMERLERRFAIGGDPPVSAAAPEEVTQLAPHVAPHPAPKASAAVPDGHAHAPERAERPTPAPAQPSGQPSAGSAHGTTPSPAEPGPSTPGALDVTAVRHSWPDVLEQVKARRRVTWMILFDKVQVLGVDGGVLTLGFPDAGAVKVFGASGHDDVLRQALIDVLGVDWRIEPVHQPGGRATPGTASAGESAAGSARSDRADPTTDPAPPGRRGAAGARPAAKAPADQPEPDEVDITGSADADDGLSGPDLVARELGGRVIGEVSGD